METVYDALQNRGLAAGQLVVSKSGHDCGHVYLVVLVEGPFIDCVDGRYRLLDKPKRKRWKHVRSLGQLEAGWREKLDALNDAGQQNALVRDLICNHDGWIQNG